MSKEQVEKATISKRGSSHVMFNSAGMMSVVEGQRMAGSKVEGVGKELMHLEEDQLSFNKERNHSPEKQ